jgi:alanine-glyoxylate transaminase/serine-glyoxylate transaminase/serine-pyruvate transaminase
MAPSALTIPRRLLYGPGPAMIAPSVYEAMSRPALGIRDPHFLAIADNVRRGLRVVFGTANQFTFPVPAGGSAGMEAAVANFVPPGSKLAVFAAGHFADRLSIMAQRHGAHVARCENPWGTVFTQAEAEAFIDNEKPDVVAFVQAETSTGAYQSGRAIVPAARRSGALVIADSVTSLGAMPVELDAIGIDVTFSCTQKGLSGPAGLSPISVSPRAWEWLERRPSDPAAWYLDLKLMAKYFEPPHVYHHTPSPPLYYALYESLRIVEEEGLENRWERHRCAGEQLAVGLERLGFEYLVKDPANRTWHLAVVKPPAGVDEAVLRQRLLDRHEIEIAGGLGQLAGKILRIGVMGPLANAESVDILLRAVSECL